MRNLWTLFVIGLATGFVSEKLLVRSQPPSPSTDDLYIEGRSSGDFPVDDEDDEDFNSGSGSGDVVSLIDIVQNEATLRNFSFNGEAPPNQEVVPSDLPTTTQATSPNQPTTAEATRNPPTTAEDDVTSLYILPEEETETESEKMLPDIGGSSDSKHLLSTTTVYPEHPDYLSLPTAQTSSSTDGSNDILTTEYEEGITGWTDDGVETITEDAVGDVKKVVVEVAREDVGEEAGGGVDGRGSRMYEVESPKEVTSENMWERTEVLAAVIACGVIGFLCALFLLLLLVYRMKKKDEGSYDLGDAKMPPTAYRQAPTKEFYA